jgi:hypothetical protein
MKIHWIYRWKVTSKKSDLIALLMWFESELKKRKVTGSIGLLSTGKTTVLETRHPVVGDYDVLPLEIKGAGYVAKRVKQ